MSIVEAVSYPAIPKNCSVKEYEQIMERWRLTSGRFVHWERGHVSAAPTRTLKPREAARQKEWERKLMWCTRCGWHRVNRSAFVRQGTKLCSSCRKRRKDGSLSWSAILHNQHRSKVYTNRRSAEKAGELLRCGIEPPATSLWYLDRGRIEPGLQRELKDYHFWKEHKARTTGSSTLGE